MKKYGHEESVWCIFDENNYLMGVIGYSTIHHIEESEIKFVRYKVYYKSHCEADLVLIQQGELRWDGFMNGINSPSFMHRGLDDLLSYTYMQFLVYYIAQKEIYDKDLVKKIEKPDIYYLLSDVVENNMLAYVSYTEHTTLQTNLSLESLYNECVLIKDELTEMSNNALERLEYEIDEDDDNET